MRTIYRIAVFIALLGLAGCASHEGPPKKTVVLAYLQAETGHQHIPRHGNPFINAMRKYAHVGKCLPSRSPGVWSCNVWFRRPGHGIHFRTIVKVMDNGGHWSPYQDSQP